MRRRSRPHDLYNCKTGTTYYWAVTTKLSGGKTAVSETGSFTTAAGARAHDLLPGVTNMRDCGGWVTEDGKTVREGLLYRCGRLNANSVSEVQPTITDAGCAVMRSWASGRSSTCAAPTRTRSAV